MSKLRVPISARDHVAGSREAVVTLVEYGDYQCPHCAALVAAQTAEFAGEHGLFWEMHEAIFQNQRRLSQTMLFALASTFGLSQVQLRDAINRNRYLDKINEDFIGGIRSGVNGTPTFFINGERYNGAYLAPDLIAAINAAMHAPAV